MKKMNIERLLQWALREELPKGHPVVASAWETTIERFAFLGVRVDVSHPGSPDGLGFVPGEPHPDALVVASAVRALPRSYKLPARDCYGLLGHYARLDHLAVRAVDGSKFNMASLVIRCAVLGQAMTWQVGEPQARVIRGARKWALVFGLNVENQAIPLEPMRNGSYRFADRPFSMVEYIEPSIGEMLEVRAEYTIWYRALELLCADLAGRMGEHQATPPVARPAPWHTGQAPEPVVHAHDGPPLKGVLPLNPTRSRALPPLEPDIVSKIRKDRAHDAAEARKNRARKKADAAQLNRTSRL